MVGASEKYEYAVNAQFTQGLLQFLCTFFGVIHKGCPTNLGIFGILCLLPLSRPVHIWLATPSLCSCGHKADII